MPVDAPVILPAAPQGTADIQMKAFIPDPDPEETGRMWLKWRTELETRLRFFRIKEDQDKLDALYIYGGEALRELCVNLPPPEPPGEGHAAPTEFVKHMTKLDKYFSPGINSDSARCKFESMSHNINETIGQYTLRLRTQASKCAFTDIDDAVRSKLLNTMRDGKLRRDAWLHKYNLKKILEYAASKEDVERQAKAIEESMKQLEVHQVHERKPKTSYRKRTPKNFTQRKFRPEKEKPTPMKVSQWKDCRYCGGDHVGIRAKCPASGKPCAKCGKRGHFARKCKGDSNTSDNTDLKRPHQTRRNAHQVAESAVYGGDTYSDNVDANGYCFSVNNRENPDISATVDVTINGVKGRANADSCASANLIDEIHLSKLRKHTSINVKSTSRVLYAYKQPQPLDLVGQFSANIGSIATKKTVKAEFLVVRGDSNSRPLLSLDTCSKLGIINIAHRVVEQRNSCNNILEKYNDVFTGLGNHKLITAKLIVDDSIPPVVHKQRRIPYNLEDKARAEEERLLQLGIVEHVPVNEPTTWCVNPVIAPKPHNPSTIRYCSDMRAPNVAIKRPINEPMTVEDIKYHLSGASVYSVLDMNEGYHQLQLHQDSRHLTTFYGLTGKLRYTRLNYGTISAQDIFDQAMDDTIRGLKGVLHIRDDFIVYGSNTQEHNGRLEALLHRFREYGLTFNRRKCKFQLQEVEFFGFKFNKHGISPAPSKVTAVKQMNRPQSTAEVRSLLGMAQYSAQFIHNFSSITTPLRRLTQKCAQFTWLEEHEQAFQTLKSALSENSVLGYYEIGSPTKVQVDAGPHGIAMIIFQQQRDQWKPVVCASRSLTATEERYSQLEREALAIRWALEKGYKYLIGHKFIVESDHQPLLAIFNNPHSKPPLRVERWLLYTQQFDFKLQYCPGSKNGADYMSRHALPLSEKDRKDSDCRDKVVRSIVEYLTPKAVTTQHIAKATKKELLVLINCIQTGDITVCKKEMPQFQKVFRELTFIDSSNIILRGNQIVIPPSLETSILKLCHESHFGIVKTKQLLRTKVWFPGIDHKVEQMIKECIPCQAVTTTPVQRNPIVPSELPTSPWISASADFCGPFPSGHMALVIIDGYSCYPEIEIVPSTSAKCTIQAIEKIFATHGIPQTLKTDNGPPFQSAEFDQFAEEMGIQHHRVTPLWPEANGQAEAFMKSLGKHAKTSSISGRDWKRDLYKFLASYRSTPHSATGRTPYELSMNRTVRTKLPTVIPKLQDNDIRSKHAQAKEKMKVYADQHRHVKDHQISIGDHVLVKQQKRNKLTPPYEPNPYLVTKVAGSAINLKRLTDGRTLTRNCSMCKPIRVQPKFKEIATDSDTEFDTPIFDLPDQHEEENILVPAPIQRQEDQQVAPPHDEPPVVIPNQEERRDTSRYGRAIKKPAWLKDYN
jgi:hypothetical protein